MLSTGTTTMAEQIDLHRRHFLGVAVTTVATAQFAMTGLANAQSSITKPDATTIKPSTNTSFGPLKQVTAGVLNVGYAEVGPADGAPVILLHGWPYDIHTYVDVAPILASKGFRVIVPYLRGYGTTQFLSNETPRNGQQAVVAVDVIALMDALQIDKAIVGGCDWGARTANIVAALWPERCKALVSVSGYLIGSQEANRMTVAAQSRTAMVVPILFRHRARPRRLRKIHARLRQADLAARLATMEFRRRNFRTQRRRVHQSGSCRRSSSTTTAGGWGSRKANRNMTIWSSGWRKLRSSACPRSPSRATPTAHRIPTLAPTRRCFRASMRTASLPAA